MTPVFRAIVLGVGLCFALAFTAQAQLELGVGGFLDQRVPTAVAAVRWGDFGVETGFGMGKSDFVAQGHKFYASATSASGLLKMYVPVNWPEVTPYVGLGTTLMNFEVASAGETFPTVYSTATGFQGIAGVEASVPGMPIHIFMTGGYSTLDPSLDIQAGGQTVRVTDLIKARGPSASVGFRLEFSLSDL